MLGETKESAQEAWEQVVATIERSRIAEWWGQMLRDMDDNMDMQIAREGMVVQVADDKLSLRIWLTYRMAGFLAKRIPQQETKGQ